MSGSLPFTLKQSKPQDTPSGAFAVKLILADPRLGSTSLTTGREDDKGGGDF